MSPWLWRRKFTRKEGPDEDYEADPDLLKQLSESHDFFSEWLQQGQNAELLSLNAVLSHFWNRSQEFDFHVFCVADGGSIDWSPKIADWFNPHIRFVAIVVSKGLDVFSTDSWTLCIVGSSSLDSKDQFLQVASWNGQVFRFFGRDIVNDIQNQGKNVIGWVYQGQSLDAFSEHDSYLGPFNGHVNGACIMKELHTPWLHWFSPDNTAMLGSFSGENKEIFQKTPWLTSKPTSPLFQNVGSPEVLEGFVSTGISNLFETRRDADFINVDGDMSPVSQPKNIERWMAHLLLTTTINIISSHTDRQILKAPVDHFFDNELLQSYGNEIMPDITDIDFSFQQDNYDAAVRALDLCLIQEVSQPSTPGVFKLPKGTLGGGKETDSLDQVYFVVAQTGEGRIGNTNPFQILTASHEDAQGVLTMQNITRLDKDNTLGLLSEETFRAFMMVDFWNPIYSWRRGVLMQYVPAKISYDGEKKYDLESKFIAAVRASHHASEADSPEHQFLKSLKEDISSQRSRIWAYLHKASQKLKTSEGLTEHLTLAESRKRLYRPLPLDEFGYTLPYARKYRKNRPLEMTEEGTIQEVPDRGLEFLQSWLLTLSGYDPQILPASKNKNTGGDPGEIKALAKPCGQSNMQTQLARAGRCPALKGRENRS